MQTFFEKVKKVVDNIAKAEKYDLILQKEGVPFASTSMDITKQVITKL
jgi:Skp family chaperone for outer membrane proteins